MADDGVAVDRSVSPYTHMSGKHSPKPGKSSHISTIKSLGLLHDLKDYICNVEMVAAEQKRELERVREEKRDIEKAVYRIQTDTVPVSKDFAETALQDMPPKLRAVFEENKVLRDKLKKYKYTNRALDDEVTKRGNQILVMDDAMNALKRQLDVCARTPAEVLAEEETRQQLAQRDNRIRELEHECAVLHQKIEVNARLAKQAQTQSAKEKEALQRQLVVAAADLDDKDKLYRAALLEARKLARRMQPNKALALYSNAGSPTGGMAETWDSAAEGTGSRQGSREQGHSSGGSAAGSGLGFTGLLQLQPPKPEGEGAGVAQEVAPAEPAVQLMLVVLREELPPASELVLEPVPGAVVSESEPERQLAPEVSGMAEGEGEGAGEGEGVQGEGEAQGPLMGDVVSGAACGEDEPPADASPGPPDGHAEEAAAQGQEPGPAPEPASETTSGPSPSEQAVAAAEEGSLSMPPGEPSGSVPRPASRVSSAGSHTSEPKAVPYRRTQARAEQRQQRGGGGAGPQGSPGPPRPGARGGSASGSMASSSRGSLAGGAGPAAQEPMPDLSQGGLTFHLQGSSGQDQGALPQREGSVAGSVTGQEAGRQLLSGEGARRAGEEAGLVVAGGEGDL